MRKEGKRSGTARRRPCVRKGAALPSKSRKQLGARGASPWTKSGLSKLAIQNLRRASKVLDLQGVSCVRFCTRAKRKRPGTQTPRLVVSRYLSRRPRTRLRQSFLCSSTDKHAAPRAEAFKDAHQSHCGPKRSAHYLASISACTRPRAILQEARCGRTHVSKRAQGLQKPAKATSASVFGIGLPSLDRLA